MTSTPLITNDAIVLGLLMAILGFVSYTSSRTTGFWPRFHAFCPPLLLCYFLPALCYYPLGIISATESKLGGMATNYLLPASLILLCVGADLKGLIKLGPKSIIMFFAATLGVIIGGIVAFLVALYILPNSLSLSPTELAQGMSTICGSWIGGSANQTAIKEIYQVPDNLFGMMVVVDVVNGYAAMALLLYGAAHYKKIDKWLKADSSAIEELKSKLSSFASAKSVNPTTSQLMYMLAVTFATVGLSHLFADITMPFMKMNEQWLIQNRLSAFISPFFWMVIFATAIGLILSFTRARELESYGASKWGTIFLYVLVTTIGMKMNLAEIIANPLLFLVGFIWICIHLIVLFIVAYLIKAPYFFVAVGSQANIGGSASAPIVAAAFHPALAPVGVIMAVIGYAVGTYGAIICAQIMISLV
jgi:uncharacterized membrane protein